MSGSPSQPSLPVGHSAPRLFSQQTYHTALCSPYTYSGKNEPHVQMYFYLELKFFEENNKNATKHCKQQQLKAFFVHCLTLQSMIIFRHLVFNLSTLLS